MKYVPLIRHTTLPFLTAPSYPLILVEDSIHCNFYVVYSYMGGFCLRFCPVSYQIMLGFDLCSWYGLDVVFHTSRSSSHKRTVLTCLLTQINCWKNAS